MLYEIKVKIAVVVKERVKIDRREIFVLARKIRRVPEFVGVKQLVASRVHHYRRVYGLLDLTVFVSDKITRFGIEIPGGIVFYRSDKSERTDGRIRSRYTHIESVKICRGIGIRRALFAAFFVIHPRPRREKHIVFIRLGVIDNLGRPHGGGNPFVFHNLKRHSVVDRAGTKFPVVEVFRPRKRDVRPVSELAYVVVAHGRRLPVLRGRTGVCNASGFGHILIKIPAVHRILLFTYPDDSAVAAPQLSVVFVQQARIVRAFDIHTVRVRERKRTFFRAAAKRER